MSDFGNHCANKAQPQERVVGVLTIGGVYNFKNQPERLVYMGRNWSGNGYWHQFEKVGEQGVWCELLDSDLHMIEEIKEH